MFDRPLLTDNGERGNVEPSDNQSLPIVHRIFEIDAELAAALSAVGWRLLIIQIVMIASFLLSAWGDVSDFKLRTSALILLVSACLSSATVVWDLLKARRNRAELQRELDSLIASGPEM